MLQFQQLMVAGYSGDGNGQYLRYRHLLSAYRCVQAAYLIIFLPVLQTAFPVYLLIDLAPHQESKSSRLDCPLQKPIVSPHCAAEGSYLAPCDHEAVSVDPVSSSSERTSPFLPLSHHVTIPTASDTISHNAPMKDIVRHFQGCEQTPACSLSQRIAFAASNTLPPKRGTRTARPLVETSACRCYSC